MTWDNEDCECCCDCLCDCHYAEAYNSKYVNEIVGYDDNYLYMDLVKQDDGTRISLRAPFPIKY